MKKLRLDQLLVNKGLVSSREKGKALVMAGQVYINGVRAEKPGVNVNPEEPVEIRGKSLPYVSRGGLKLEKALKEFNLALAGKIMLDIGASTGGFTDCALKDGAVKVYAVDVGYGQLDWSLRQDPRVVVMERTNARYLTAGDIPEIVEVITIDVSFISLKKILPPLKVLLKEGGFIIALIKPQFEAGRELVGKKGVVKDAVVHCQVVREIITFSQELGLLVKGVTYSPVRGPEGNIEFLIWLEKGDAQLANRGEEELEEGLEKEVAKLVAQAHAQLK